MVSSNVHSGKCGVSGALGMVSADGLVKVVHAQLAYALCTGLAYIKVPRVKHRSMLRILGVLGLPGLISRGPGRPVQADARAAPAPRCRLK